MNIDELTDAMVMCRAVGHAWDEWNSALAPASAPGTWPFTLLCVRCTTERHDLVNRRTGAVESRRYIYPAGYRLAERGQRLFRDELRRELLLRRNRSKRKAS